MITPDSSRFSGPIVRISILSLMLGLAVMIVSVLVLMGFKREIQDKMVGFNGHLHITRYVSGNSIDLPPMIRDSVNKVKLMTLPEVRHVQSFVSKAAVINTDEEVKGAMVKGVGTDFDSLFFSKYLVAGHIPNFAQDKVAKEVLVSKEMARRLKLRLGHKLRLYFVDATGGRLRARALRIGGIYNT
ncbi:MAG: ABC transporter permease, partial [Bacteroidia bacterium]